MPNRDTSIIASIGTPVNFSTSQSILNFSGARAHMPSISCDIPQKINNSSSSIIVLSSTSATLTSTYAASKTSSLYSNVGKLTLTISGGATQGSPSLSQQGYTIDLTKWPFPVPYNYDIVLENGTYTLALDTTLLPGAGLKVGENATLEVASGKYLAVFTGSNDHTKFSSANYENGYDVYLGATRVYPTQTTTYGTYADGRYPLNDTLSSPSGGSNMANFVVNDTLNVQSGAHFGGIVQTNGTGTINMQGSVDRFTRQLGLTGNGNDTDQWTFAYAGATIYEFYPQSVGDRF